MNRTMVFSLFATLVGACAFGQSVAASTATIIDLDISAASIVADGQTTQVLRAAACDDDAAIDRAYVAINHRWDSSDSFEEAGLIRIDGTTVSEIGGAGYGNQYFDVAGTVTSEVVSALPTDMVSNGTLADPTLCDQYRLITVPFVYDGFYQEQVANRPAVLMQSTVTGANSGWVRVQADDASRQFDIVLDEAVNEPAQLESITVTTPSEGSDTYLVTVDVAHTEDLTEIRTLINLYPEEGQERYGYFAYYADGDSFVEFPSSPAYGNTRVVLDDFRSFSVGNDDLTRYVFVFRIDDETVPEGTIQANNRVSVLIKDDGNSYGWFHDDERFVLDNRDLFDEVEEIDLTYSIPTGGLGSAPLVLHADETQGPVYRFTAQNTQGEESILLNQMTFVLRDADTQTILSEADYDSLLAQVLILDEEFQQIAVKQISQHTDQTLTVDLAQPFVLSQGESETFSVSVHIQDATTISGNEASLTIALSEIAGYGQDSRRYFADAVEIDAQGKAFTVLQSEVHFAGISDLNQFGIQYPEEIIGGFQFSKRGGPNINLTELRVTISGSFDSAQGFGPRNISLAERNNNGTINMWSPVRSTLFFLPTTTEPFSSSTGLTQFSPTGTRMVYVEDTTGYEVNDRIIFFREFNSQLFGNDGIGYRVSAVGDGYLEVSVPLQESVWNVRVQKLHYNPTLGPESIIEPADVISFYLFNGAEISDYRDFLILADTTQIKDNSVESSASLELFLHGTRGASVENNAVHWNYHGNHGLFWSNQSDSYFGRSPIIFF